MSESRNELLAWINDLLQLNYRKVEQAGTGWFDTHVSFPTKDAFF